MKTWIIYDSKFGNNKQVAETLADIFKQDGEVRVHYAKEVSPKDAAAYKPDILLFGGPIRMGMVSFTAKRWVRSFAHQLSSKGLKLKKAAAWGTHGADDPKTPPKFAWPSVSLKWKALLAQVPAEKALPDVQGISVTGMEGPMEAGWQDLVAKFAERVKAL